MRTVKWLVAVAVVLAMASVALSQDAYEPVRFYGDVTMESWVAPTISTGVVAFVGGTFSNQTVSYKLSGIKNGKRIPVSSAMTRTVVGSTCTIDVQWPVYPGADNLVLLRSKDGGMNFNYRLLNIRNVHYLDNGSNVGWTTNGAVAFTNAYTAIGSPTAPWPVAADGKSVTNSWVDFDGVTTNSMLFIGGQLRSWKKNGVEL